MLYRKHGVGTVCVDVFGQTKVLEDMLRFEKQQREAEEAAFKAQKKLLVAEVKKLRTANVALKAECDDLRQQLRDLRQSVSQLGR